MKKIFAIFAMTLGLSTAAQAGFMIEPYIGYLGGDHIYKSVSAGSTEYTDTLGGSAMGIRLGYKFLMPWVAFDYTMASGTDKSGIPGTKDADYSAAMMGFVAGVDLPILLRAWAGYGLQNNITFKPSTGDQKLYGTYTKVGVGFKGFPFISINAEYIIGSYNKYDDGTATGKVDSDTVFSTLSSKLYLISISLPL